MKKQFGLASVELAVISAAFMLIVFGAIEISRMMFTWNTLDAITQRAVRVATVCPPNHAEIKQIAMFGAPGGDANLLPDFSEQNLVIEYFELQQDAMGNNVFQLKGGTYPIDFVRARIVDYQHSLAIPFISDTLITSPSFVATLPAESLGYIPNQGERSCYKTYSAA